MLALGDTDGETLALSLALGDTLDDGDCEAD